MVGADPTAALKDNIKHLLADALSCHAWQRKRGRFMTSLSALVALVTALTAAGLAQEAGFAMPAPDGWHRINSEGLVDNIQREVKMDPAELRKLVGSLATSTFVVAYVKYQPAVHPGLIPKVQVTLRRNPAKTFEGFLKMISRSAAESTTLFPDFELTDPPREVSVGGRRAVLFSGSFSLETRSSGRLKVRARIYAVMNGDNFFQINFIDGPSDDCSAVFDWLVGTIRFD